MGAVPFVWTSANGIDWESRQLPGFDVAIYEATVGSDATVLLGEGATAQCDHPSRGVMWRRVHGEAEWASVPFHEMFCAGGFGQLAAGSAGFVVTSAGEQPFAWASREGWIWGDGTMTLEFESPPRRLTTIGEEYLTLGRGERTNALISGDGLTWRPVAAPPVPPPFGLDGVEISVLLETRVGILAFFTDEEAVPKSAWRRELDGSWTRLGIFGLEAIDYVEGGFGLDGRPYLMIHRNNEARLLTSVDLENWVELPVPRVGEIVGMARHADRTVLVATVFEPQPNMGLGVFVVYVSDGSAESDPEGP